MIEFSKFSVLFGMAMAGCLLVSPLERTSSHEEQGGQLDSSAGASRASAGEAGAGEAGAGEAGADSAGPCVSNLDCSLRHDEEPYRCRADKVCVALASDECIVFGDSNDDNAVFIGAYGVREGSSLAESTSGYTYRLAIEEFASYDDLPGTGKDRRSLVTLLCDNDATAIARTMTHLVEEVQVPAILAALDPDVLLDAFRKYGHDRTFFLSPYGGSTALSEEEDFGLIWSMLGQPADFVPAYGALLAKLEAHITVALSDDERLRVAAISTDDAFSTDLANALLAGELSFNEQSLANNLAEGQFFIREIPADASVAEISDTVQQILEFRPHVVLSLAHEIFTADGRLLEKKGILANLEELWGGVNPGVSYPYYVLSPLNTFHLGELVGPYVGASHVFFPDAHQRFLALGAAPASESRLYDLFKLNLEKKFPGASAEAENLYDAFYFLVYAVYASGGSELTGQYVVQGMQRLLSPNPIHAVDVGPRGILDAYRVLGSKDGAIRLLGTLGPPDFELKAGVRVESGAMSCFDSNSMVHYNALRFDRESGEFHGDSKLCKLPF